MKHVNDGATVLYDGMHGTVEWIPPAGTPEPTSPTMWWYTPFGMPPKLGCWVEEEEVQRIEEPHGRGSAGVHEVLWPELAGSGRTGTTV